MRKFFTLLGLCAAIVGVSLSATAAGKNYKSVVFEHTDSHLTKVNFEYGFTTMFENGDMVLYYTKGTNYYEIRQPLAEIRNWVFSTEAGSSDLWAGIDGALSDAPGVVLNWSGKNIELTNLPVNSTVMLTAVSGQTLLSEQATGTFTVSTEMLVPGVYVLTINDKSFKVAVK
ncbi:MAG: T9SS type A sorting domain-containing protein [Firmicutes bacterium]|nr:T9SS type A sorting domain-containing protein [Bacillota bacterium]MCM1401279.1 T9SS type A sorting domain-containing protein [Bacteroides sp.]MCM1476766.1 T9SS type A sorting domain-containing protein [Bacteroides sp.]